MSKKRTTTDSLNNLLRTKYAEFVEVHTDGVSKAEWRQYICSFSEIDPEPFFKWQMEMVGKAANSIWEEDPQVSSDVFCIDGSPVQQTFTFPDPASESGYRRISHQHATVLHVYEDARVAQQDALQKMKAADEKFQRHDRYLELAGGNPRIHLSEICDKPA